MIATLHGLLFEKTPTSVVIECGGVGYEAAIAVGTYNELPAVGGECRLYVRHVVRDDDELLFGFVTKAERQVFDLLTGVSGVGPKSAMSVLSGMTVEEFKQSVANGDVKRISSVKGIGKKTAERIIVELRGKIDPVEAMALHPVAGKKGDESVLRDTVQALVQLGFPTEQATRMVQAALDSGADASRTDELLRKALAAR